MKGIITSSLDKFKAFLQKEIDKAKNGNNVNIHPSQYRDENGVTHYKARVVPKQTK